MHASFVEAVEEQLRSVILTLPSIIFIIKPSAQSLMPAIRAPKTKLTLYLKVKMRAPGKSFGRKSLSQNALVVGCVHVSVACPLSP